MNRRELLKRSAAFSLAAGIPVLAAGKLLARNGKIEAGNGPDKNSPVAKPNPLVPPAHGTIPVAFPISEGAVIIDFCGPWEVFQDASVPGKDTGFELYTVAETTKPIRASGGMKIVPDYTFQTAPAPKVIVIPAQSGGDAMLEWIRKATKATDVTMSVCTGAFVLAKTGLLSGRSATTFHAAYSSFAAKFPDIHLKRGARFVEDGNLATAGGLSSGIDLALRVVERYYGRDAAQDTAYTMEYQGQGWMNPDSNEVYAKERASTEEHPLCPVCGMDGSPDFKSEYKGKTYLFCSQNHKETFDAAPASFAKAA